MNIPKGLITIGKVISKHSPEILTAMGIVGMISAGITAVMNTPDVMDILEKHKDEEDACTTKIEKIKFYVKHCWRKYVFPIALVVISVVCIIFARRIDAGRTAALMTAYKVSEEAADRFESATREVVGDKTMEKIENKVAEKRVKEIPYIEDDVITLGDSGPRQSYFEEYSGKFIRCTRDYLDKALNEFNLKMQNAALSDESVTVNDYLDCLGMPRLDPKTTGADEWYLHDVLKKNSRELPTYVFEFIPMDTGEVVGYFRLNVDPVKKIREYYD